MTIEAPGRLRVLHESVVQPEEIDALGHLNVRHYGERALAATDRLLDALGLEGEAFAAAGPLAHDLPVLFTRYHREQHTGAPLVVHGGVIAIRPDGLRLYHELRNPERDELAATFLHDVTLHAEGDAAPLALPEALRKELAREVAPWPEHGRSRSIDVDAPPRVITLEHARESGLAFRLPRRLEAADCDADGRIGPASRPFTMWGGDPIPPATREDGPPLLDLPDGGRMGWAAMESRSIQLEPPTVGMTIQSFAAVVELARKTSLRRYWVFDVDTGRLLLTNQVVDLALHLGLRRAIEIPEPSRSELEAKLRPDLR